MKKRICYFHSLIPFIIILSGCGTAITSEPTIVINNDESLLAQRMQRLSLPITVEATNSKARLLASNTTQLTLIAESDPPKYADTTLQATEVRVRGNKAYVSFNIQGEQFLGAVDVYDISDNSSPQLISNAIFPGVDINGLSIDPGGNEIYLAAASDAQELKTPALLRRITLLGGKLTNDYVDVDIDSYAATDVDVAGNHIYITSGADYGKITVLNKNDLSLHYQFDANDARSVDVDAQDVTVFAGTPATLYTFDRNSGELVDQFTYTGASIVNSKSTVETKQAKAFIGAGDGGTHIVCIATGELLANIPQAIIPDLDPKLSVTNSVTVYKRAVFMGNGEAGVYLALASENFNANNCIVNDLQLAGKLQLPDAPSINHIVYRHDLLFVASGLGGLKIISVNIANSTDDNDDT